MSAKFIGVGVGPGDPELMTLKAVRLIKQADVISYIANSQGESQAKNIASIVLAEAASEAIESGKQQNEIPVLMPMSEDRSIANKIYNAAAEKIQDAIAHKKTVVFICEGDPLFFGSFAYLLERLQKVNVVCEVVPGISSVHAAASRLQLPLTMLKESFAVMSGRHSLDELTATLRSHDSIVIMKAGRSRQKIIRALKETERLSDAKYLEYIGRDSEKIELDVAQLKGEGPYFSLFVITKNRYVNE